MPKNNRKIASRLGQIEAIGMVLALLATIAVGVNLLEFGGYSSGCNLIAGIAFIGSGLTLLYARGLGRLVNEILVEISPDLDGARRAAMSTWVCILFLVVGLVTLAGAILR